jgi:uncharacterized membrane protein YdfJ with MMPL/SSD domain
MFARWGRFVYRRRRWVALVAVLVPPRQSRSDSRLASSSVLTTGRLVRPEFGVAAGRPAAGRRLRPGRQLHVVLFQAPGRTDAASAAFQAEVATALAGLRSDPRVTSIVGYSPRPAARASSAPRRRHLGPREPGLSEDQAIGAVDGIRTEIATPPGFTVQLTGARPERGQSAQSEKDLSRAETISLPIALLILMLVFGTLVAAGLPLFVAGLTIPTTLALIWVLAQHLTMSIFVTSVVTMLGLALAIDYSLFMVSRFREELACGATVEEAVERTSRPAARRSPSPARPSPSACPGCSCSARRRSVRWASAAR